MAFTLQEKKPITTPAPVDIIIGGIKVGGATPDICGTEIRWHAVIRLGDSCQPAAGLAQGFGETPDAAIGDAIISARKHRDDFACALQAIEREIEVDGKTAQQIKAMFQPVNA